MLAAFLLSLLAALPDALLALWLKLLGDGMLGHRPGLVRAAAIGLGVSATATWFLRTVSTRVQRRFRDKVTIALESHVARLQASVATIAHHERPDYLDRLSVLRDQVFVLDHMYMSLFSTCGWILRLGVTVALLVSIHPALALLAVFALPTVLTSTWRPAVERAAQERGAQSSRLARHLFTTATTSPPGKEVRVTGIGDRLVVERRAAWERWYRPGVRRAMGLGVLAHAGVGSLWRRLCRRGRVRLVGPRLASGRRAPGARGRRATLRVHRCDGRRDWISARHLDGRIQAPGVARGLRRVARRRCGSARARPPCSHGIRLEHVSFAYPGTSRLVLDDVSLTLPAGAVVAIVGENGAGKTTLVKLLSKMYEPSSGAIFVDDAPLGRMPAAEWRSRLAGAFQDFFRFEFRARQTVGIGDLPRMDDEPAVLAAVERAGADDVVARLKSGLDTQLGPTWPDGVDVSFGQWQKLALARGFMREAPLLLVLDEPTAALDAETEHALFERYAAVARGDQCRAATPRRGAASPSWSHTGFRPCGWPI